MNQLYKNSIKSVILSVLVATLYGCPGSDAGGGAAIDPCENIVDDVFTSSGSGSLQFFSSCGLMAVDPEIPTDPLTVVGPYVDEALVKDAYVHKDDDINNDDEDEDKLKDDTEPVVFVPSDPIVFVPPQPLPRIAKMIPGSLQKTINGTWDTGLQKVTNQHLHAVLYAQGGELLDAKNRPFFKGELPTTGQRYISGYIYKISALKGTSHKPVRVSSENRAHRMCSKTTLLPDYADINNSIYVYFMPGPDGNCDLTDDNIEKHITLGMDAGTPPRILPPGSDIFLTSDIVDKNTGAITGWFAIKNRRKQRRLPDYQTQSRPSTEKEKQDGDNSGFLNPQFPGDPSDPSKPPKPYPLGFRDGTPVIIASDIVDKNGEKTFDASRTYFVNFKKQPEITFVCPASEDADTQEVVIPPSPSAFNDEALFDRILNQNTKINPFNVQITQKRKILCLDDGTILGEINTAANDEEVKITLKGNHQPFPVPFFGTRQQNNDLAEEIGERRIVKARVIEERVAILQNAPALVSTQARYTDFYRCNLTLSDCVDGSVSPLKETLFDYLCPEEGRDQMGEENTLPGEDFVIRAYNDKRETLLTGETVTWIRGDGAEKCTDNFLFGETCEDVTFSSTFSGGSTSFREKTGHSGHGDEKGSNVFKASIAGLGSHVSFAISKPDRDGDGVTDNEYNIDGHVVDQKDTCFTPGMKVDRTGCNSGDKFKSYSTPSCATRNKFYILDVSVKSPRGSKAAFTGKVVIRFDLLYKPYWPDKDKVDKKDSAKTAKNVSRAKKSGTVGILYVYDIDSDAFDVDPSFRTYDLSMPASLQYTSSPTVSTDSKVAFPDGMTAVYDNDSFFFSDNSSVYDLPLTGGGKADHRQSEGARLVTEMALSSDSVVYTTSDRDPEKPIATIKAILKSGGGAITILGDTIDSVENLVTDQNWPYVYFETLRDSTPEHPSCNTDSPKRECPPGEYVQIYSAKTDGTESNTEVMDATLAGRTETRVLSVIKCNKIGLTTCRGTGRLISARGVDQGDQIKLGSVDDDIHRLFFQGYGDTVLGLGKVDSTVENFDIFQIVGDQADSLERVLVTPLVPEELF